MLLSQEVHRKVLLEEVDVFLESIPKDIEFDCKQLGIWIDPIDSTAEYINGQEVLTEHGICASGLKCVTVLIGVFDKSTGIPIIGVLNQPFSKMVDHRWNGCCFWGLSTSNLRASSCLSQCLENRTNVICISSSEDDVIKEKLKDAGFTLVEAAGAGYKILTVITQRADAYILSKSTTFKWDTCGPQAILKSIGGNIVQYNMATQNCCEPIDYPDYPDHENDKISMYCNSGGIIAYCKGAVCDLIVDVLSK